jgi:hypothetical protein
MNVNIRPDASTKPLTHHDITKNLIIAHLYVPYSNSKAKHFLELEFDG